MPNSQVTAQQPRVTVEIIDEVAIVTLNRGLKYNALDMDMFYALDSTASELADNKAIRAVIVRGDGKVFCAGLDVKSIIKNPLNPGKLLKREEGELANLAQKVGYLWRQIPVPVIAVTHGVCFGGGLQIALGADFRYSTADCEFSVMEIKWGLIPDMSGMVTMRELTRIDIAKELTMTGRKFSGIEAEKYGLVTHVCDDPMAAAMTFVESIKTRSPDAIVAAKSLLNETWVASEQAVLVMETQTQKKVMGKWNQLVAVTRNFVKKSLPYRKRSI
ncbi:crotonase/enoyl-CoA hydratase family protein [Moritella sp.]|uniref:crotonase/enoyl-CoA hydratase family protein n=1 Tax=Moritella sp. TaxID=78556 RepID=UPI001DD7C33D|nr:crotonase/enoyl-CoA hydratase family protein [Moritella sp.]MCJ8349173.1 crotonase/enoyl-CoA hydratase family protein [Moritella sp.]NQZ39461.1 crotonase/enoyl-CoA hydratase family protein [Moritella sp.]NQZ49716.1 crotonase/enoyl-CoA hydratase family protein [Moritella sp.]